MPKNNICSFFASSSTPIVNKDNYITWLMVLLRGSEITVERDGEMV